MRNGHKIIFKHVLLPHCQLFLHRKYFATLLELEAMKLRQGGVRRELLLYKYHICRKLKQWARPGAECEEGDSGEGDLS